MGKLDFKGLNEYALSNMDSVLHHTYLMESMRAMNTSH